MPTMRIDTIIDGQQVDLAVAGREDVLVRQFTEAARRLLRLRRGSGGYFGIRLQWAEGLYESSDFNDKRDGRQAEEIRNG